MREHIKYCNINLPTNQFVNCIEFSEQKKTSGATEGKIDDKDTK